MPKIVHIIPQLGAGGAEKFTVDLCNQLSFDSEVHLIILNNLKDGKNSFFKSNIYHNVYLHNLKKSKGFQLSCVFNLFRLLHKLNPDVVNTHLNALLYVSVPILILPFKFYHTVHNIAEKEQSNLYVRLLYKYLFRTKKVVPVAISKVVQNSIFKVYQLRSSPIILNGCVYPSLTNEYDSVKHEIDSYKKDCNTKIFITVARFSEQKNLKLLITSFNQLTALNSNVILLIIGDGDPNIKSELYNLSCSHILYLGNKSNVSDYLSNSDVFCLSSKWEGLPITILEAFSFGLPVISTPVGGIPELITHKITGLLSENITVSSYFNCMETFLSFKSEELKLMNLNNKATYKKKYSIAICSKNYLNLYSQYY